MNNSTRPPQVRFTHRQIRYDPKGVAAMLRALLR
jgi:hypothetical protein